jgi:hypothetical protein
LPALPWEPRRLPPPFTITAITTTAWCITARCIITAIIATTTTLDRSGRQAVTDSPK